MEYQIIASFIGKHVEIIVDGVIVQGTLRREPTHPMWIWAFDSNTTNYGGSVIDSGRISMIREVSIVQS